MLDVTHMPTHQEHCTCQEPCKKGGTQATCVQDLKP